MKVKVMPIVIGKLDTVIKGLVQGLEDSVIRGRLETNQITVLLSYLPTPPLRQDMTQGQFLSGV